MIDQPLDERPPRDAEREERIAADRADRHHDQAIDREAERVGPNDYSFEAVNTYVHSSPSPDYEHLQWLCLDLANRLEKATQPC